MDEKLKDKLESFSPKEYEEQRKNFYHELEKKGVSQEIYEIINIVHGLFLSPERIEEDRCEKQELELYWDHRETIEKLLDKIVDVQSHWRKKILSPYYLPSESQFEPAPDGQFQKPRRPPHRPRDLGEECLIEQGMGIFLSSKIGPEEAYVLLHRIFLYFFDIEKDSSAIKTKYHTLKQESSS